MRLLLSAYSCCPNHGSEPGVGWNTVEQAAADPENEVHVLVAAGWEKRIRRNFDPGRHPNVHFHFVGVPGLDAFMQEGRGTAVIALIYYHLWQWASFRAALRLHDRLQFDLVHHVTFVKYNTPSLLPLLGIPFLWGPLGGAEHAPAVFYREFGVKTVFAEGLRRMLQRLAPLSPLLRWTARNATLTLGVTQDTVDALKQLGARGPGLLPAVALSEAEVESLQVTAKPPPTPLMLLFVGRLIPWKGIHLGIRALASCQTSHLHLRIIGEGPLRTFLEKEVDRLQLNHRVQFNGNLPRAEVFAACRDAHGFLYPSLHDSGGNAVIEAMAAGNPVVHLAYGGPDLLVPEEAGWKVQAGTPNQAVEGLAAALDHFARDAAERNLRGEAAKAHVLSHHTWRKRGEQLQLIYEALMRPADH